MLQELEQYLGVGLSGGASDTIAKREELVIFAFGDDPASANFLQNEDSTELELE